MAQLQAAMQRIKELEAQVARRSTITFKVSDKGAVSAYGLGRYPVTLYAEQWERLLGKADELRAFIEAHRSELKTKAQAQAEAEAKAQ